MMELVCAWRGHMSFSFGQHPCLRRVLTLATAISPTAKLGPVARRRLSDSPFLCLLHSAFCPLLSAFCRLPWLCLFCQSIKFAFRNFRHSKFEIARPFVSPVHRFSGSPLHPSGHAP